MTAQAFSFEDAMPQGFVYDTEPPCRAVVAVGELFAPVTFNYFKAVQRAFYEGQQDVTQESVLAELFVSFAEDPSSQTLPLQKPALQKDNLLQVFRSDQCKHKTQGHFHKSRQFGVRGFPTVILQSQQKYFLLTSGYRPYDELQAEIEACLRESN
jgi:putative protein-disulfide isomerase